MHRLLAFAAPPVLAAVVLLHRNDPAQAMELAGSTTLWIWIHVALLAALALLAGAVHHLLAGLDNGAARLARGLLPLALVAYAAFDSLVGLGTGVLVERAADLDGSAAALVEHWWSVPAPISIISGVAQLAWVVVLGAVAAAHFLARSPRRLVAVLAGLAASFPLLHVRPVGLVPVALLAAALFLTRRQASGAELAAAPVSS